MRMCEEGGKAAKKGAKKIAEGEGGAGGGGFRDRIPEAPAGLGALFKAAVGLGGVATLGYYSLYDVDAGHRAIIFNRVYGIKNTVVGEGMHIRIPFFEWPILYDVRTRPRNIQSLTGSKDLQMVNINVRVLSKPSVDALPKIYERLNLDYDERVLPSIVNEVCKQVVAQFTAVQLLTQREQVSRRIRQYLMDRALDFDIILEDVAITDLRFGRDFTAAVESKQVAQQDSERAKFLVDKALEEKRSIVISAQGEAKAAEMISKAIDGKAGFVELRKIERAREIAQMVSRSNNKIYLDADTLLLNLLTSKHTSITQNSK